MSKFNVDAAQSPYLWEHACCLYTSDQERRRVLTRFLADGIKKGEKVVCSTVEGSEELILADLAEPLADPGRLLETGRLAIVFSEPAHLEGGTFPPEETLNRVEKLVQGARAEGFDGVRVAADLRWIESLPDARQAFLEYEARVNRMVAKYGCSTLCLYDRGHLSTGELLHCLNVHPVAIVAGEEVPNPHVLDLAEAGGDDPVESELKWRRRVADRLQKADRTPRRLREVEGQAKIVARSISDAVVAIDDESRIVYANPAMHAMVGEGDSEASLVGRALTEFMPHDLALRHQRSMKRYLESGVRHLDWTKVDMPIVRADGSRLEAQISFGEYEVGGERFFTGVIRDVTDSRRFAEQLRKSEEALRASEARFRQIAEHVDSAFWIRSPEKDSMEYVSPSYAKIWGRSRKSVLEDPRSWLDAIHPNDRGRVEAALSRQASGGYEEEYRVIRPDGTQRWIRDRAFPVVDAQGSVQRIIGIADDITERRDLELRLRQAEKMEAIGRLAAGVAHDFNNLLTVIRGHAELAQIDLSGDSEVGQELAGILAGVEQATAMTRHLLLFSREGPVEMRPTDVGARLRTLEPMLRRLVAERIALQFNVENDPKMVLADGNQLHRAVLNLVLNAADAIQGDGRITVSLDSLEISGSEEDTWRAGKPNPGRYVRLSVADTGKGIAPEDCDRIFDPFFTTKPEGQGTGLGLSTVFGFIKQMDGHALVESEPGAGATFHLLVPELDVAPEGGGPHELEHAQRAAFAPATILVVEDELALAKVVSRGLTRKGYEVLTAVAPADALATMQESSQSIDLVLTDVVMPMVQGPELAKQMQEIRPELPIVYMSGHSYKELKGRIPEDATAFLQKPFSIEALVQIVEKALEASRST